MRKTLLSILCGAIACGCGGAEEPGWDFGDERIVIWTIPRPGEEPAPRPGPPTTVDEPDAPEEPPVGRPAPSGVPAQPSVSPVACDADDPVLTVPGSFAGVLARGRGQVDEVPCAMSPGSERRLRLEVPRRMGVEIWTTYAETEFPPVLLLQAGCDAETADLHCSSPIQSHPDPYSAHIRTVLEPGVYTLLVDERNLLDYGEGGDFVIHADEVELDVNAMCADALPLYPDNIGQISAPNRGSTGDLRSCFVGGSSRNYWKTTVAPRSAVRIRAAYDRHDLQPGPSLEIREACFGDCTGPYGQDALSYANDSDEVVEVVISSSDYRGEPHSVWLEASAPLAANAECALAERLSPGVPTVGDMLTGAPHESMCQHNQTRQLFYRVDVPPQHRLIPEVSAGTVGVHTSCGTAQQCLYTPVNETGLTQPYIVSVGDLTGAEQAFELTAHTVPLAPNSTCFAPVALAPDRPLRGDLIAGGEPAGSCQLILTAGYSLWYSVEVPALSTVDVEVRPDSQEVAIGLEAMSGGCGGECVASHDPYFDRVSNPRVSLANDDASPMTVLLAVTSETRKARAVGFEIRVTSP